VPTTKSENQRSGLCPRLKLDKERMMKREEGCWKEGRLVQGRNEIRAGYRDPPPHPTNAELCWYFLRARGFMQSRRDAGIGVRKLIRPRRCFVILQLGNKT